MARFYVYELKSMSGATPYAKTTDGALAVHIFQSADSALRFSASLGHESDWRVKELDLLSAIDCLIGMRDANGVTAVWPNPNPQLEGNLEVPLEQFLSVLNQAAQQ